MLELSAPLRMTWELPADAELAARLWTRLVEARVLSVEIFVSGAALGGLEGLVSEGITANGPRLTLLGEPEALLAARESLGPQALAGDELGMLPPYRPLLAVEELAAVTRNVAPTLWSTPDGIGAFGEALEIARGYGLASVWVLNPPTPAPPLAAADRAAAVRTWRKYGSPNVTLRVHDLFLAEALGLDPFAEYPGCQAAGTLAHLTAEGFVTACRTLPIVLGSLKDTSLGDLWQAAARAQLRAALQAPPTPCKSCNLARTCGGGCRGLGADLERDPSCPGVRSAPSEAPR